MAEGFGDEVLPECAEEADQRQPDPVFARDRHPVLHGEQAGKEGQQHQEPEDQADRGLGFGHHAHGDRGGGIGDGSRGGTDGAQQVQLAASRLQHPQHAGQANADRKPASPADVFLENGDSERRDDQRRHEKDRIGIGQRQHGHGGDEAPHHDESEHAAEQVQLPADDAQVAPAPGHGDGGEHEGQGGRAAHGADLEGWVAGGQHLEHGIHAGEERDGNEHRGDAAQA